VSLAWRIEYADRAKRDLGKLDRQSAKRILDYMDERVAKHDNPRDLGKALSGEFGMFWRYRVGNFRIICDIEDKVLRILVVRVGNRKEIYR
jgi:mRNA interferase RelE/StbE